MKVYRPLRGGSWYFRPEFARASYRNWVEPSNRFVFYGLRCALIVRRRR